MTQALNVPLARTLVEKHLSSHAFEPEMAPQAKRAIGELMAVNPIIEIYYLGSDGRIEAFSAPPSQILRERVDLRPIRAFVANSYEIPLLGDDPKDPRRQKIFSAAMIDPRRPELGFLYVVLGGA